jgi:hypothetical protein
VGGVEAQHRSRPQKEHHRRDSPHQNA